MNTFEHSADMQVALLIENVKDAKILSDGFRELGIFAHYYQDLDELWVALNSYTPDFCVIDIKKMSQGELLFKHHPKVKSHELKFAFYYADDHSALLTSTYDLPHYGLVRAELNLLGQLTPILRRRQEELHLVDLNSQLVERIDRFKARTQKMGESYEVSQHNSFLNKELKRISNLFGKVESAQEMIIRMNKVFEHWEFCDEFGIYYLSATGQKLVSPQIIGKKIKQLPDLWLAEVSSKGIPEYAQEMAYDVAYGVISDELVALTIQGQKEFPDMMVLLKLDMKKLDGFSWDLLETKLSSEYRRALLGNSGALAGINPHYPSIYDVFQRLDDVQFYRSNIEHRSALIDLTLITTLSKQKTNNRFYWRNFFQDFSSELEGKLRGQFQMAHYGVEAIVVLIDKKYLENDYHRVKQFVEQYPFWKYFEDDSFFIKTSQKLEFKMVAPSAVNIMRQLEDGYSDIMQPSLTPSVVRDSRSQLDA